jgi:hypothetical protein
MWATPPWASGTPDGAVLRGLLPRPAGAGRGLGSGGTADDPGHAMGQTFRGQDACDRIAPDTIDRRCRARSEKIADQVFLIATEGDESGITQ